MPLDDLLAAARALAPRAYAPYSGRPQAAALLTASGVVVPGVRVESASFGLTCDALLGATSALAASGGAAPVALAFAQPHTPADRLHARALTGQARPDGAHVLRLARGTLPPVGALWAPTEAPPGGSSAAYTEAARALALERAVVPESAFPVGCWARVDRAGAAPAWVPGVNVEAPDWGRVLCAERGALHLARALGLPPPAAFYLACAPSDCSPCGACRQWLTEHAPAAQIWMHRRDGPPLLTHPPALLPGAFEARSLRP